MIYVDEGHGLASDLDELPPMSGIRIRTEVVDEDVMLVRIEYAEQSFRSHRRAEVIVTPIGESDDETRQKCMDWLHKTSGVHPLVV